MLKLFECKILNIKKYVHISSNIHVQQNRIRVLTRILKFGVKCCPPEKSWSFTILIYWDFPKSWSQKWKVGVTYTKSGVNEISENNDSIEVLLMTTEVFLMTTHNICFRQEIRKILCGCPLLSVAMQHNQSNSILFVTEWHSLLPGQVSEYRYLR